MGPRVLTASSGLARGAWLWIVLRQPWQKNQPLMGVKGLVPLDCLPTGGEWGSPSQFPRHSKNARGFPMKINYSVMIRDFYSQSSIYDDCRCPEIPAVDQ